MSGDIRLFLEEQKSQIFQERKRLGLPEGEGKNTLFKEKPYPGKEVKEGESCFRQEKGDSERKPKKNGEEKPPLDKKRQEELGEGRENDKKIVEENKENCLGREDVRFRGENPRDNTVGGVLWCANSENRKKNSYLKANLPSVEPLDLARYYEPTIEGRKQVFIDSLANSEGPFSSRSDAGRGPSGGVASFGPPSLRRGEYAPSHASLRAAPHEGVGEYELRRGLFAERRKRDYLRHLAKQNEGTIKEVSEGQGSPKSADSELVSKFVQTDIQNIDRELVQYELRSRNSPEKELSPRTATDRVVDAALRKRPYRIDQRLTSAQNELLLRAGNAANATMDKPKSILSNRRTGSPRDRYSSELPHSSYTPTFMDGFSYSDRSEEVERERLKRETYQHELRLQIEEKRRLQAMHEERERRERDLENNRLEQQLLRMQEEQAVEEQRRARRNELMRRHSDDLLRRKTELHELQRPWRRHADSESGGLDAMGVGAAPSAYGGVTSLSGSHYSPPVSRRGAPYSFNVPATNVFSESTSRYTPNRFDSSSYSSILRKDALNRMDSLSSYDTVPLRSSNRKFDRFDSLSRIDSLSHRLESMGVRDGSSSLTDVQRRHSATQQDLSLLRKSPRLPRRNSSSRFEDSLPIPVLKARSPVAKELKNAVPFSSQRALVSEAQRRLEDRWQIPAVQKTIFHSMDSPSHQNRGSILTQLGSIRAQLQREQLRMDESLRRRGLVRTRTTDDY